MLQEPAIVSMDANFGLVHKTSSGEGHGQLSSRHEDLFFQEHADIKTFMNDYNSDKKSQTSVSFTLCLSHILRK